MKLLKYIITPHLSTWLNPSIQLNPFDKDFKWDMGVGDILKSGMDFLGGYMGMEGQKEANAKNIEYQKQFAKQGLGWKIQDAAKYGIHPLAAIGASPGPMPTIPMQNTMSHLSSALQNQSNQIAQTQMGQIDRQIKTYVLAEAQRRASDSKYDYQLLIPVEHPHYPGTKWWAFNSRFQAFGQFANTVVMAANYDQALEIMGNKIGEKGKALIDSHKQTNVQKRDKQFSPKSKRPGASIYDDMGGAP